MRHSDAWKLFLRTLYLMAVPSMVSSPLVLAPSDRGPIALGAALAFVAFAPPP
jgi:hypothetical protein